MMNDRTPLSLLLPAALLAIGLAGGGWLAANGMIKLRTADRYVTVKGSAEKEVAANLLVWPLAHSVSGNDLAEVQRQLDANTAQIRDFFISAGFGEEEIITAPPRLEDRWVWAYGENRPAERFRYSNSVTLRTQDVAKAQAVLRRSGELVSRGILLSGSSDGESNGPEFSYTDLNRIKPTLIAEATAEARKAAEQFAKDSGADIGGIRSANQGVITITERDRGSPQIKTVRVVTTVEYFLKD
ncbi:SIMPL domain-containing protein [Lysobacteraceae bacterium NML120232]|nr:SIMPL domain-containing protein [Xanthomonadaceae bacterium NML120232]